MTNWTVWKQEKNYQKLFWAGVINGIGNRFTQVALLALLYRVTGSGVAIGLLFAIRMAPFFFIAPIGGMLADRFSKKAILVTVDLLRVPAVLCLLFVREPGDLWIVYTSAFLISMGDAIYSPARMSAIPALVKSDRLIYVNAIEQIMIGAVLIIGSSTGGILAYFLGNQAAFMINGLTFLLSAYFISRMVFPSVSEETRRKSRTSAAISPGKLVLGSSVMIAFFIMMLTMPLANGIDNILVSIYGLEVFDMGELGVGFMYGALGIGLILSSFFSHMLKRGLLALAIIFIALEGTGHILLSLAPSFYAALFTVVLITFAGGIGNICLDTVMMKFIPRSRQGTFFGLMEMISNLSLAVSMGTAGFLLEIFAPRTLSLIIGLAYLIFAVMYALLFARVDLVKEKREFIRGI
ncbi:MFS transporter [Cytobacillus oceanisediminis]|uniref:MFS transporter n=1 Tax=Bacillaceae TaxID=186817 RepID=UPI0013D6CCB3|nr:MULTISPECIES: MFS transporter [Bacillaceae]MCC3649681.1 MFS transporter [Cytobacillus oceanisediminis]